MDSFTSKSEEPAVSAHEQIDDTTICSLTPHGRDRWNRYTRRLGRLYVFALVFRRVSTITRTWLSVLAGMVLLLLCSTHTALADAAPPEPPPGSSLDPGESVTNVRMTWENVLMTVGDDSAHVQAVFRFQNQGAETEFLDVRFPLGMSMYGDITDFSVSVDGFPVQITNREMNDGNGGSSPWATWQTTFPPDVQVEISVTYTVMAYRYNAVSALHYYSYVLETGAGWYGTIGEGTITVRLPHEANENTVCTGAACSHQPRPDRYTISGTDVIWHFTDLEPTEADNVELIVLNPALHRLLVDARSQVQMDPNSLDAYLNLARLISPAVNAGCAGIWDYGCTYDEGPTNYLIPEAAAAYRHALDLAPNDVNLYAEYLEYLLSTTGNIEEIGDEVFPTLEYALTLDSDNKRLAEICRGLEELGLWSPTASASASNLSEEQPIEPTQAPSAPPSPTPAKEADISGFVAAGDPGSMPDTTAAPVSLASGGRVLIWVLGITVFGLFCLTAAVVVGVVVFRKLR